MVWGKTIPVRKAQFLKNCVHHHCINAEFNNGWLGYIQSPNKQLLQQMSKKKHFGKRKIAEKTFDCM
jgi:hypothetical protein